MCMCVEVLWLFTYESQSVCWGVCKGYTHPCQASRHIASEDKE